MPQIKTGRGSERVTLIFRQNLKMNHTRPTITSNAANGFVTKACLKSPCNNAREALVPPQSGHFIPVI